MHDVLALPERGGKVRIVTKSPAALVALLHWARKTVLKRLKRCSYTSAVLRGDRREAIKELFQPDRPLLGKREIISADLTAASDRIAHDQAQALWKGFARAMKLGPDQETLIMRSLGP